MNDHNHVTRDIKPLGMCPGCDRYHRLVRLSHEQRTSDSPTGLTYAPEEEES